MNIDDKHSERYYVIDGENIFHGWQSGWNVFTANGSPFVSFGVTKVDVFRTSNYSDPLDVSLWQDTVDYDQNNPGILEKVHDIEKRAFQSDIEKAFWVNVTRVPICVSYLAACAKVRPLTILELGTGGDSAHSTGMFLYWLLEAFSPDDAFIQLVSVDRHPLSHVWLRYREEACWSFIQGDSITAMKSILNGKLNLPHWFDMIFIDSSHLYPHTLYEIRQASFMTDAILLDDTTVLDVKKSLDEFLKDEKDWLRIDLAHGVSLIERHQYL